MGEDADEDLEEEIREGIKFDGIPIKALKEDVAKQIGSVE